MVLDRYLGLSGENRKIFSRLKSNKKGGIMKKFKPLKNIPILGALGGFSDIVEKTIDLIPNIMREARAIKDIKQKHLEVMAKLETERRTEFMKADLSRDQINKQFELAKNLINEQFEIAKEKIKENTKLVEFSRSYDTHKLDVYAELKGKEMDLSWDMFESKQYQEGEKDKRKTGLTKRDFDLRHKEREAKFSIGREACTIIFNSSTPRQYKDLEIDIPGVLKISCREATFGNLSPPLTWPGIPQYASIQPKKATVTFCLFVNRAEGESSEEQMKILVPTGKSNELNASIMNKIFHQYLYGADVYCLTTEIEPFNDQIQYLEDEYASPKISLNVRDPDQPYLVTSYRHHSYAGLQSVVCESYRDWGPATEISLDPVIGRRRENLTFYSTRAVPVTFTGFRFAYQPLGNSSPTRIPNSGISISELRRSGMFAKRSEQRQLPQPLDFSSRFEM